jgi:hypothetical protein
MEVDGVVEQEKNKVQKMEKNVNVSNIVCCEAGLSEQLHGAQ